MTNHIFFPYESRLSGEEAAVIKVVEKYEVAFDGNDFTTMERLLADDIFIKSSYLNESFRDKKSFIEALKKKREEDIEKNSLPVVVRMGFNIVIKNSEAEVTYEVSASKKPPAHKEWRRIFTQQKKLRQEKGEWKIYYSA